MGLGTHRAPLTALAPAKNKGQHLFGGGGQHRAQGPWYGCLTMALMAGWPVAWQLVSPWFWECVGSALVGQSLNMAWCCQRSHAPRAGCGRSQAGGT